MPYVVTPGGTYDLSAFSCYYPQQADDGGATWDLYGSQIDYSNPVLLAPGWPDKRTAQAALEQMLATDSVVRQFPAPAGGLDRGG